MAGVARPRSRPRALEPSFDRLGDAAAVGSDRGAVEADAAVADEHGDGVGADLGVDGDLASSGELRRIRHRLARREHELARAVVEPGVTRGRELDRHAVQLLHICRRVGERRDKTLRIAHPAAV